ncbi:ferritin family protein [Effusibacillus lacus]|uniref:Rubrerythrin diiron-binding domain-containing protein n=1 Tax=Effusibacillus lacus TaxID=1348429 RepID=A0A292YN40_9BACL|nr:ferritin-like domain-containing protein [Effusibacillus lacus]TCS68276.1 rubrerythrin [Effusibacillus lacus]GAX90173.1 hypothetical protein EFBL_1799 [Effusibacillus lacus]
MFVWHPPYYVPYRVYPVAQPYEVQSYYWPPVPPEAAPSTMSISPATGTETTSETVPGSQADDRDHTDFVEAIERAINGEHNAIRIYGRLAELAPNNDFRQIVQTIRNDEEMHFKQFSDIYSRLTGGREPKLEKQPLPNKFIEGVEESIRDELEDSKFYQTLSEMTDNPAIQRVFLNASHDEARHATWFSYIWNKAREKAARAAKPRI